MSPGPAARALARPAALLVGLLALAWATAVAASPLDLDAAAVPWSRLTYRPAERPDELKVEVSLSPVAPDQLSALLGPDPADAAPQPEGAAVFKMTSTIEVALTGRTYRTEVWFHSAEATPLQRRRDKIGSDPSSKIYRYLDDGVRRLRRDPDSSAEAQLAPEHWTRVKNEVYPYGAARTGCPLVSDPNLLFLLASTKAVRGSAEPLKLCVFNKETIYRVRLSAGSRGTLEADYLESKDGAEKEIRRQAAVRRITIQAEPPAVDGASPEPFEFFEMGGDIEIDLDIERGLPLRISGEVPGFGRVAFRLSEVVWRR